MSKSKSDSNPVTHTQFLQSVATHILNISNNFCYQFSYFIKIHNNL